ncbi:MAG: hypothetical protein WD492_17485 [Alkalispirochaeta sp.]
MTSPRVTIICGAYGVGKSECAIALARMLPAPVTLIDLDVVNPYFRSREARKLLEGEGITVIGSSLAIDTGVDVPAVSGAVVPALRDPARSVVVDLGGDPAGARAIRQFIPHLPADSTEVLYVVNRYRPENGDIQRTIASVRAVEEEIGLSCGGLISNSHMLHETTCDHINAGLRLCLEVTSKTQIPLAYTAGTRELLNSCGVLNGSTAESHMYVSTVLREDWMNARR